MSAMAYYNSAKNTPFIKETIKNVKFNIINYNLNGQYYVGKFGVLKLTGPIVYSETIIPMLKLLPT